MVLSRGQGEKLLLRKEAIFRPTVPTFVSQVSSLKHWELETLLKLLHFRIWLTFASSHSRLAVLLAFWSPDYSSGRPVVNIP